MSSNQFQEQAKQHAVKAIDFDQKGQIEPAIFYYLEASQALIHLKNENDSQKITSKLNEYLSRAEQLKTQLKTNQKSSSPKYKTELEKEIEKGLCLLSEGVDEDSEGNLSDAFELYTNAVEIFIKIPNKSQLINNENFQMLQSNINTALKRAEEIKKTLKKTEASNKPNDSIWQAQQNLDKLNIDSDDEDDKNQIKSLSNLNRNSSKLFTKDEIDVLRRGSFINQRNYVPFFHEVDGKERFYFPLPFTDKEGKLALSQSQRERFIKWARPDEIFENPTLMMLISSFSVKQTCISDCSFVASLTVCAQYERKFGRSLLSRIIYPQNKKAEPIYNPCGKYMISLNINGCPRKIIVDDYFPIDSNNQLLCSLTTNKGELWVSLLEKAYMKVMGGYDFPGSNSNIDLHCLTNWIPERISLHGDHSDFDKNSDFERMFERLHCGDCLITLATGSLSKDDETRTGLVPTHAYAVLDIRKFKDKRLFQLKNPWSHLRWKGNYSEYDVTNWTSDLKNALNYDPNLACNVDNGIFWIDFDSLIKFFDVFYLSWNPNLFQYTSSFHRKWSSNEGPIKDRYNLGENPQYVLKVKASTQNNKCTTWLLLTRHIVDKADFAQNKEYIALVVYKNNGKRIYYPMEPPPFKEGIRINSPHYLVKLVDDEPGPITYTLVISQYEKYNSIYYTLKTYSTMPFELNEIKEPYKSKYHKKISGKWDARSAGGCSNYRDTCKNNPQYQLTLANNDTKNCIKIELKGPQQYSVGFDFNCVSSNVPNSTNNIDKTSTGDYRKGFCVLPMNNISGGTYTIRPSTYMPGQEGPFILEISSNREFSLNIV